MDNHQTMKACCCPAVDWEEMAEPCLITNHFLPTNVIWIISIWNWWYVYLKYLWGKGKVTATGSEPILQSDLNPGVCLIYRQGSLNNLTFTALLTDAKDLGLNLRIKIFTYILDVIPCVWICYCTRCNVQQGCNLLSKGPYVKGASKGAAPPSISPHRTLHHFQGISICHSKTSKSKLLLMPFAVKLCMSVP